MSKANALRWRTPWKKLGMKLAGCIWNLKSYSTLTISKKWKSSGLNNHSSFFCCRPLSTSLLISLDLCPLPDSVIARLHFAKTSSALLCSLSARKKPGTQVANASQSFGIGCPVCSLAYLLRFTTEKRSARPASSNPKQNNNLFKLKSRID